MKEDFQRTSVKWEISLKAPNRKTNKQTKEKASKQTKTLYNRESAMTNKGRKWPQPKYLLSKIKTAQGISMHHCMSNTDSVLETRDRKNDVI